jgi:hypothetical protein
VFEFAVLPQNFCDAALDLHGLTCWVTPHPSKLSSVASLALKTGEATSSPNNFWATMQTQAATAMTVPALAVKARLHQVWAPAVIACGLGLTAAWISLLGYGFVSLIELMI